jgi:hypothetical protein
MGSLLKLLFWGLLWIVIGTITSPFKKKGHENCLTWAMKKWEQEDGYLVIRWCRSSNHNFKWPHFLWLPLDKHQDLQHVVPSIDNPQKKSIPEPWFDPKHLQGDALDSPKDN